MRSLRTSAILLSLSSLAATPLLVAQPEPVTITNRLPLWFDAAAPPRASNPSLGSPMDRLEVGEAIRSIYDQFSRVSRKSGQEITVRVSGFSTYRPEDFADLPLSELYSVHRGPVVRTTAETHGGRLPSQDRTSYHSTWVPAVGGAAQIVDLLGPSLSYQAYLEIAAKFKKSTKVKSEIPETISGLTTFDAVVEFEGRVVPYRALVLWRELAPDLLFFTLEDDVVGGAGGAFNLPDTVNLVPLEELTRRAQEPPPVPDPIALLIEAGATCIPAALYPAPLAQCEEPGSALFLLDLTAASEPLSLGFAGIPLRQIERGRPQGNHGTCEYLMAEWALVEQVGAETTIKNRSSRAFEATEVQALADTIGGSTKPKDKRSFLLAALPSQGEAKRPSEIPELRLVGNAAQPTRERGRILVLADFSEDHRLQALDWVNHELLGSHELMLHIERTLALEPSAAGHRVVVFAWLNIGEKVEIESYLAYLPRCCCGTVFCD